MPLLVSTGTPPPGDTDPIVPARAIDASWFAPDGTEWLLTQEPIWTERGPTGLEVAPREVTRQALPTGGGFARWSYAAERLIGWPLLVVHDDPVEFRRIWRGLVRAFTSTSPAAGVPTPGRLRVTRPDGTWREIEAYYLEGFEGEDSDGQGIIFREAVISLVATDPWWYGEGVRAARWEYDVARSYLAPYETVSKGLQLGTSDLTVAGDVDALPTWTITGPAVSVTAIRADGAQWKYNATIGAGQQIIVDVGAAQVTNSAGESVVGNMSWPTSRLWTLPAGDQEVVINIEDAGPGSAVDLEYRPRYESA